MRRLLWIGDAACASGFAKSSHYTLEVLQKTWDLTVLGLNFLGDPHRYSFLQNKIYPCYPGGDLFGLGRIPDIIQKLRPEVVVVQNDPWNIPQYLRLLPNVPVVGAIAVDGANCKGRGLNGLVLAIFWTQYGADQARAGGYAGPYAVVPLGVDLDVYNPGDRQAARKKMFQPKDYEDLKDAFIVGNINRNQPRKRLDLTISYFADWIKSRKISDAYLYLHIAPTGDVGFDCQQLMAYFGVANRLILSSPEVWHGLEEEELANTYRAFDVQLTTTQGEGWGLTTMEGMACGIPQIVPQWAALAEWCGNTAVQVPCSEIAVTGGGVNVIGGIPNRGETILALDDLYYNKNLRASYSQRGLELVSQPQYRWPAIGELFAQAIDETLAELATPTFKRQDVSV
jgi:D-inositol-3-phosphate glycosyltransferase